MKRGKYEKVVPVTRKKRGLNTRIVTLMLALTLLVGVAVGGTIAWLTATDDPVVNTFTPSDINITLEETTGTSYKMVPGCDIAKNPVVTVKAGSEACWLFVKVEKSAKYDTYLEDYAVAEGWTELITAAGINYKVYYRRVEDLSGASAPDKVFHVLADDKVTVLNTVTKQMMEAIDGVDANGAEDTDEIAARPTLTFTAYAVQKDNIASAQAAWETLFPANPGNP